MSRQQLRDGLIGEVNLDFLVNDLYAQSRLASVAGLRIDFHQILSLDLRSVVRHRGRL